MCIGTVCLCVRVCACVCVCAVIPYLPSFSHPSFLPFASIPSIPSSPPRSFPPPFPPPPSAGLAPLRQGCLSTQHSFFNILYPTFVDSLVHFHSTCCTAHQLHIRPSIHTCINHTYLLTYLLTLHPIDPSIYPSIHLYLLTSIHTILLAHLLTFHIHTSTQYTCMPCTHTHARNLPSRAACVCVFCVSCAILR